MFMLIPPLPLPDHLEISPKFKKALSLRFKPVKGDKSSWRPFQSHLKGDPLYHVVLTRTHLSASSDPNCAVQTLRICGTYTTSKAALDAAHRVLFESGLEREWFEVYDTKEVEFVHDHVHHRDGLAVFAKAKDGSEFRVTVSVGKDLAGLRSLVDDDSKIHAQLYHVVVTNIFYGEDDSGTERTNTVEASFPSYGKAREFASKVLLDGKTHPSAAGFEEYEQAAEGETDCGYGENVLVHAVGETGGNLLVSVVQGQELESVRLAEAAMRVG